MKWFEDAGDLRPGDIYRLADFVTIDKELNDKEFAVTPSKVPYRGKLNWRH